MKLFHSVLLLNSALEAHAFWRMRCSTIQTGRVDPIINPGQVAGHVHMLSGASNINTSSTYNSLRQSFCSSCQIQEDKSAYWTPLLYYQRKDGSFIPVRNDGTVVYYLGRGEDRANIIPFPPGFQMVSGDPYARSYDNATLTYKNGRPISDRVSFNCLQKDYKSLPETYGMPYTDCPNGLRAQIQFQSCWDGINLYKTDQSHVAYMSQIDNGVCPPSHPKLLPHLFYEIYYWPNEIDTSDGGRFVFANGDPTGYGFHGDFLNGWNIDVLTAGIKQCINSVESGQVEDCPPLYASNDDSFGKNCPEQAPLVNEQVKGVLSALPGCNTPTPGPTRAPVQTCNATKPSLNTPVNTDGQSREVPTVNLTRNGMTYRGCYIDNTGGRALSGASYTDGSMTLESCATYCRGKGFSIFGAEYARECYCGNSISAATTKQSDCNMACSGNLTEYCGDGNRLSVWSLLSSNTTSSSPTTSTTATTPTSSTSDLADTVYLGCYSDSSSRVLSPGFSGDNNMTLELCRTLAQSNNYKFFGLEYAGECFAGNNLTAATLPASSCNMPCKGNKNQTCGGPSALSVFQNSKYVVTKNANVTVAGGILFEYQGCYNESPTGRALGASNSSSSSYSFTDDKMTVNACATACYAKGFSFAGVEFARECYCNNAGIVNGGAVTSDAVCDMSCAGDVSQWCGGSKKLSLFKAAKAAGGRRKR